jgi:hypothetical protein
MARVHADGERLTLITTMFTALHRRQMEQPRE